MADTAPPAGKKTNVFTNRIGPLPMWAWVAIVGGVIIAWAVYSRSKSSSTAAAANSASTTPPDVFMVSPGTQSTPPEQDSDSGTTKVPWGQNANNIAADARDALIKSGVKNPTAKQIAEERQDILQSARQPGPDKRKKAPAHHKRTPVAHHRHK